MAHVRQLAACGIHETGSKGDRKAARYIREQMKRAGLSVTNELFSFKSFTLDNDVLEAGTEKADVVKLGFNPYSATDPVSGELAYVATTDTPSIKKADLDGKLVVISGDDGFKMVSFLKSPKAVLSLSAPDFERLKASGASSGELRFRGKVTTAKSANIVGVLAAKPGAREIIVSAHYDSIRGPGANDNATGVAVLLELARYFHAIKLPPGVSIRFVAFGGEEFGFLGSKAYLEKHQTELQNCELLFNIDQVGGDGAIYTDTRGGVRGLSGKFGSQLPKEFGDKAITDTNVRWRLLMSSERPLWISSNVPEWLRSSVSSAGTGLGRKVVASEGSGSDHRVFVQAGIVATDITVEGGAQTHAPTDVPEAVNADSMELAARLVLAVIEDLLRSRPD
jgi:acetylornithine deacetylase/succinyl-diaminopimelate desuccinylase-like protein